MKLADLYKAKALRLENGSGGGGGDYLELSGGTMAGDINMDGNAVTGIGTPTNASNAAPKGYVDDKIDENKETFVAVYSRTTYADVIAAIGANKIILLDMPANNNLFNITYATYTNGGNATMYAIFRMNDRSTLMTATLTPADNWTITHTDLQDKLVSGTSIKTINGESVLGSGDIEIGGGIFIAEQNVTTAQEIIEALGTGKVIYVRLSYPSILYLVNNLKIINENTVRLICYIGKDNLEDIVLHITVESSGWSNHSIQFQDKLISGTNIKTINGESVLGSGNLNVGGTVDSAMSDTSENAVQNKAIKSYIDTADTGLQAQLGDLTALTTDEKTNLVGAINEVYEKSGEPFRVKNWAASSMNVQIPYCTEDIANTSIPKMDFAISDAEGADYQIVGMIAYEVKDASGQRINCWPVCQFTGNGQKTLTVRWACMGTTRKTASSINAWVLLKHR